MLQDSITNYSNCLYYLIFLLSRREFTFFFNLIGSRLLIFPRLNQQEITCFSNLGRNLNFKTITLLYQYCCKWIHMALCTLKTENVSWALGLQLTGFWFNSLYSKTYEASKNRNSAYGCTPQHISQVFIQCLSVSSLMCTDTELGHKVQGQSPKQSAKFVWDFVRIRIEIDKMFNRFILEFKWKWERLPSMFWVIKFHKNGIDGQTDILLYSFKSAQVWPKYFDVLTPTAITINNTACLIESWVTHLGDIFIHFPQTQTC